MSDHLAPDTLHRGIKLPYAELDGAALSSDLLPGSDGVDENGNRVVHDGNEHGVYMSTNPQVARVYSSPQHGDRILGTPTFSWRHSHGSSLVVPRVGIQYEIRSDGLPGLRPPSLKTFDPNNGFEGEEWIADIVPADHQAISALRIGEDLLHPRPESVDLSGGADAAIERLHEKVEDRMARIAIAQERLGNMTEDELRRHGVVDRALQDLISRR